MDIPVGGVDFSAYGLDARLLQGIKDLKFVKPTPIQAACIPLALRGKDILARAQTGTGKTAAYGVPVIQRVLADKKSLDLPHIRAVIVVPTRDLCHQGERMFKGLLKHLKKEVSCASLVSEQKVAERTALLQAKPDILITTPSALFQHLSSMTIDLTQLLSFVIDEADLVISESSKAASIKEHLPTGCQVMMLSATLTSQVMLLKTKIMNSAFVIKIQDDAEMEFKVKQHYILCSEVQKYMSLIGLLSVGDIEGKTVIFVNSVHTATKLQIFLDLFSINAAVLSSAVPENSRNHIVYQFNKGYFDHLIATDESMRMDDVARRKAELEAGKGTKSEMDEDDEEDRGAGQKRRRSSSAHSEYEGKRRKLQDKIEKVHREAQKQGEYGVHRGIDFQGVNWVINFEMCKDAGIYTHRIGRTGRAQKEGNAISFFTMKEQDGLLQYIIQDQKLKGKELLPHSRQADHWEKLRVRCQDVLDGITPKVIDKARVQILAREVVNSAKLKNHWRDNPEDLRALKHLAADKPKAMASASKYLHFMPSYMGLSKPEDKKEKTQVKGRNQKLSVQGKKEENRALLKNKQPTKKRVDPFKVGIFEQAKQAEKRMSSLELAVLDPDALRRKQKERAEEERKLTKRMRLQRKKANRKHKKQEEKSQKKQINPAK